MRIDILNINSTYVPTLLSSYLRTIIYTCHFKEFPLHPMLRRQVKIHVPDVQDVYVLRKLF